MELPTSKSFSFFKNYNPLHNIIHYYVDLSCFLVSNTTPLNWWALNRRKRMTSFYSLEVKYRSLEARDRFTAKCFMQAQSQKRTVCGERLGFMDFFVPVLNKGSILGFLQAGSFVRSEITPEIIENCWKELTGKEISVSLPEFRDFVKVLLEIPVLDGTLFLAFQESLEMFARLLSDEKEKNSIGQRLQQLLLTVFSKKLPHSYWMDWALGRPTAESVPPWDLRVVQWDWIRNEIGITRIPTTVLTVIPQRLGGQSLGWTAEMLRIYRFQRQCFYFAQTLPQTVGGKLEDYGAVFVTSVGPQRSRLAQRQQVRNIAMKIRDFAVRELGGPVLMGIGETVSPGEHLDLSYRQAVLALHLARRSDKTIIFFEGEKKDTSTGDFSELRRILAELNEAFASGPFPDLEVIKDRFLKQVINISFQNPQEIRWHFQYALDRLAETLQRRMEYGKKEAELLWENLNKMLEDSATIQEMILAFQEILSKLERQIDKTSSIQTEFSIEKVRDFLTHHLKESLRISRLAEMAGVSPSTFSRRFKKLTGLGLEAYLQNLRLEEAKRLLKVTRLPVVRIGKDCGFKSNPYFFQLFRRKNGCPPQAYRRKMQNY